jgi:CheY-like chemotaxis protein
MNSRRKFPILIADDDPEDRLLIKEALEESRVANEIHFVNDGEQLLQYLRTTDVKPGLILLDLNMPRMDGREALREIKNDAELKRIPVIILTTSKAEEDIYRTYDLGVNSFVTKPVTFASLVKTIAEIGHYWFEIVELPGRKRT